MAAVRFPEAGRLGLLILLGVVLQAVVTSRVIVLGVSADFFLIFTVLVALGKGSVWGALFGFAAGLVADIVYLEPVGLRAFIYVVLGYGVGRYSEEFGVGTAWSVVVVAAVAAFAAQVVYGLFQLTLGQESFFRMVREQMFPAALVDALVAAPVYLVLVRLGLLEPPGGTGPSFK
ncbi:MAG: hypothetical protein Kow00129_11520 [Thermoleophilia bacterium]